jgi:hypothetical protein
MNWLGLQSDQATYYWLVYTSTRDDEAAGLADAARAGADACGDAGADAGAGHQAGPSRLWKISRSGREERGALNSGRPRSERERGEDFKFDSSWRHYAFSSKDQTESPCRAVVCTNVPRCK